MNLDKLISVIFHPIFLPIIGTLLFFSKTPYTFPTDIKRSLLSIILIATYLIPSLLLFILKKINLIDNYQIKNIQQRKLPVVLMAIVFYTLGKVLFTIPQIFELSILFIGTSIALITTYILFIWNIKSSLHMLGIGAALAFLLIFSFQYKLNLLLPIALTFLGAGSVAKARLSLKAHTVKEIYIGFSLGILSQILVLIIYSI